ncbi:FMN-linked oxidoreductase [Athelia psychrophila]|uniref:FMN-linked oxidoreductase n=1 Tax=Athelia psychrophila TaxID=1759441 RepID=A0A167V890_9AGAM|nr:FMN-linked oxidoreductase [Fibularhizoctonia sp. CBS 109695]
MPGTERIHPDPQPAHLQATVYADGLQGKAPAFPYAYKSWEKLAHAALPKTSWGYVHGSAGEGATDDANKAAFSRYGLVPRRLVRVEMPDLKTRLFGETFDYPIALAPSARRALDIPPRQRARRRARRRRARHHLHHVHRRLHLHRGRRIRLRDRTGVEIGLSDPVFCAQWAADHGGKQPGEPGQLAASSPAWARTVFPGASHAWEDLAFLREHWKGPIVLKGIQTVADARRAVEAGMDGIVVSNHGGRQVDGSVPSLDCLAPIVKAVGGKLEVLFDSGVRSGADVCKALALGAKVRFLLPSSLFPFFLFSAF